jgi:hypothetical protein
MEGPYSPHGPWLAYGKDRTANEPTVPTASSLFASLLPGLSYRTDRIEDQKCAQRLERGSLLHNSELFGH